MVLEALGFATSERIVPCLMASGSSTHAPVHLYGANGRIYAPPSAQEALHGYPQGISKAFGRVEASNELRTRMLGNGFHPSFVHAVFSKWEPWAQPEQEMERKAMYAGIASTGIEKETPLEKELSKLTDTELEA